MKIKFISFIFLLTVFFVSCTDQSTVSRYLDTADFHMEDNPEVALQTLKNINQDLLATPRLKARFALLYFMALDKNYVEVKSDSIIAPALKYYKKHGSNDEKLLAYHYNGIIAYNAGDTEQAMKYYVEAERYISNATNKKAIARLFNAKMLAYHSIYDYSSALQQAELAADWFLDAKDSTKYFNIVNDIVILEMILDDSAGVDKWLDVLYGSFSSLTEQQKSRYYAILLNIATINGSDNIRVLLDQYLSNTLDCSMVNWIYVAEAYRVIKDYKSALSAISSYLKYGGIEDAAYFACISAIYESMNDAENALQAYKEYVKYTDEQDLKIFNSDTKFIEERYQSEIKSINQRAYIIIISLSLFIILLLLVILMQRMIRVKNERRLDKIKFDEERRNIVDEKQRVEAEYVILKEEKEETEKMFVSLKAEAAQLKKIKKDKSIDKDILISVEQRLNVLNMFILAELSESFEKIAYRELEKLMENREEFMESTKKTFMISHPKFIDYLHKANLTEWEIGCCCLYCIGLNGAEISEYLNRKAIYNVNGVIRQKLNIPRGKTQIDIFLKQKMRELHS